MDLQPSSLKKKDKICLVCTPPDPVQVVLEQLICLKIIRLEVCKCLQIRMVWCPFFLVSFFNFKQQEFRLDWVYPIDGHT